MFYNLILDFCVITRTRFSLRDKRLFEITEVEITRVDCTVTYSRRMKFLSMSNSTPAVIMLEFRTGVLKISYCD